MIGFNRICKFIDQWSRKTIVCFRSRFIWLFWWHAWGFGQFVTILTCISIKLGLLWTLSFLRSFLEIMNKGLKGFMIQSIEFFRSKDDSFARHLPTLNEKECHNCFFGQYHSMLAYLPWRCSNFDCNWVLIHDIAMGWPQHGDRPCWFSELTLNANR